MLGWLVAILSTLLDQLKPRGMSDVSCNIEGGDGSCTTGGSSGDTGPGAVPKMASAMPKLVEDYGCSDSESSETSDEPPAMEAEACQESDLSEMVVKNNIINACAHGPLPMEAEEAAATEVETDDETQHILIDSNGGGVIEYSVGGYRERDSDDSVSSDSSSEVNSVKDAEESDSGEEDSLEQSTKARTPPRVRGELGMEDLPPIEELSITVPEHQTKPIGKVNNIIDKLVIVQAFPETPAVDIESVLFLEKGKRALGKVFDVFGPVTEPYYCVRFNSSEQIREQGVERGLEVFIAPQTHHTSYVFVSELMRMRGSDASWLNDIEPPPGQVEYSDDEEERKANRTRRERRRNNQPTTPARQNTTRTEPTSHRPTPTRFEEQMNRRNLLRTAEAAMAISQYGSWHYSNSPFRRQPPPMPAQDPPWGGVWPPPPDIPAEMSCPPPPFMPAMYRPPPGFNIHPPNPFARIPFNRMSGAFERPPRFSPAFGQVPWFMGSPPPPPPNT